VAGGTNNNVTTIQRELPSFIQSCKIAKMVHYGNIANTYSTQ